MPLSLSQIQKKQISLHPVSEAPPLTVLITGDFYVQSKPDKTAIFGPFEKDLRTKDVSLVNLEAPLTAHAACRRTTGPSLAMSPELLALLRQIDVDVVTLANNHIMDRGETGLSDTLNACKHHGIKTVGAAMNRSDALAPLFIKHDKGVLAILNVAEGEFAQADTAAAGAAPFDALYNLAPLCHARQNADFVIVVFHGGNEYFSLPSPRLRELCHFFIDNGAAAVIGHHSHVPGAIEIYRNSPIVYSLGNFIFDRPSSHDFWYQGFYLKLHLTPHRVTHLDLQPYQHRHNPIQLQSHPDESTFLQDLWQHSSYLLDEPAYQQQWQAYCQTRFREMVINSFPRTFLQKILVRLGVDPLRFVPDAQLFFQYNTLRSLSHQQVAAAAWRDIIASRGY